MRARRGVDRLHFKGPPQAILEIDLRVIIEKRVRSYRVRYFCNMPEYAGILLKSPHAEQDTENASGLLRYSRLLWFAKTLADFEINNIAAVPRNPKSRPTLKSDSLGRDL